MTVRFSATSPIINWSDSAKPFGEKLHQAVEYLKFRARNFNALAAYKTVEKFVAEQQKYLLFRQLFPDEWNRSQTSLFKAGVYENYTERTNEFFELVNEHLFPILGGWYQEPEADFDNFNIYSLNVDFCCDEVEYEYLQVSYLAALLLFSQADELWEYFEENYKLNRDDFPEIHRYSFDKIWNLEKTGRLGLYLGMPFLSASIIAFFNFLAKATLAAWPGLAARICALNGLPAKARSPMISSSLCLAGSLL